MKSFETKERKYLSLAGLLHGDLSKREFEELKRKLRALDAAPVPPTAYSKLMQNAKNAPVKTDGKK